MAYSLKKQRYIVYALIFFVYLFGLIDYANAYTYERTPTGTTVNNPVTLTWTVLNTEIIGVQSGFFAVVVEGQGETDSACMNIQLGENILTFTHSYSPLPANVVQVIFTHFDSIDCTGNYNGDVFLEGDGNSTLFTINATVSQSTSIWSGTNGFWGSTTPLEMSATVFNGTTATFQDLVPLFKFAGVPIAFMIAVLLISFINRSIEKKKEKKASTEDLIYHSANDLEFKRNYGKEMDT